MITYAPLKALDYVEAKIVFREVFAYSEWKCLAAAWRRRASYGCFAVRYRGVLVGFSLVSKKNVINYISVDPDFQGYKIGSTLLTMILGSMSDARLIRLTTAGDERLLGWYSRFGFIATETIYEDDGEFVGAHMMRRQRSRSSTYKTN